MIYGSDSVIDMDDLDRAFDDGWFELIWFSDLSRFFMSHWGVFPISIDIYRSPHWFAWSSSVLRYTSSWWYDFILSWYSEEPLLSHSARFILSDIVVILGRSYLRCLDSHVNISTRYMSDLLYIPHGVILELSWQIGYIWCHTRAYFPPLAVEAIVLAHICYSFSSLGWDVLYLPYWSLFLWFSLRWAFSGARCSRFDCPTSHDFSVDCYFEIETSWFSWESCETVFTVDLIIPTR